MDYTQFDKYLSRFNVLNKLSGSAMDLLKEIVRDRELYNFVMSDVNALNRLTRFYKEHESNYFVLKDYRSVMGKALRSVDSYRELEDSELIALCFSLVEELKYNFTSWDELKSYVFPQAGLSNLYVKISGDTKFTFKTSELTIKPVWFYGGFSIGSDCNTGIDLDNIHTSVLTTDGIPLLPISFMSGSANTKYIRLSCNSYNGRNPVLIGLNHGGRMAKLHSGTDILKYERVNIKGYSGDVKYPVITGFSLEEYMSSLNPGYIKPIFSAGFAATNTEFEFLEFSGVDLDERLFNHCLSYLGGLYRRIDNRGVVYRNFKEIRVSNTNTPELWERVIKELKR